MNDLLSAAERMSDIPRQRGLVTKFAQRYSIDPDKLLTILKATCFKVSKGEVSTEQMAALLVVADQHGLNPFTREIFAFEDKQRGIVPVVSVDGWSRIINDHPEADGLEFRYSEQIVALPDAQPCPEWCEVVVHRKDRGHPTIVREYLGECYRPPFVRDDGSKVRGPWQSHTKRFLRHKTLIQGARIAFGFSGIYDEDEAARIIEAERVEVVPPPKSGSAALLARASQAAPEAPGAAEEQGTAVTEPPAGEPDPGPEIQPEGQTLDERLADHIAVLDEARSARELEDLAKSAPADVRADPKYLAAVDKRRETLAGKKGKP